MSQTAIEKVEDALKKLESSKVEFLDQADSLRKLEQAMENKLSVYQQSLEQLNSENRELRTQLQDQATEISQLKDAQIGTARIQDNAITRPKLAAKAVDGSKIADGVVGESKLDKALTKKVNSYLSIGGGVVNWLNVNGGNTPGLVTMGGDGEDIGNGWERLLTIAKRSKVILFRGKGTNFALGVDGKDRLALFSLALSESMWYQRRVS